MNASNQRRSAWIFQMLMTDKHVDPEFQVQLFGVVEHIRGALTELLSSIEADPGVPYGLARRLAINKNLAWKICRIVTTHEPFGVVEHLPGSQGFEILLSAATAHGAPPNAIVAVRTALADFARLVETHAGDRRTFDLMLASHHEAPSEPVEESRRQAFEGNSAIWGLQGRVRFASFFLLPSRDNGDLVDCAVFGGLTELRRLRPNVGAPVFIMRSYNDDGTPRDSHREPLDPAGACGDPAMLVRTFCSPDAPPLLPQQLPGAVRFELPRGPVGNTGLTSWVYGWRTPRLGSIHRDDVNHFGEHPTRIFVPVEALQCDLFIHRSLPFSETVRGALYSHLAGGPFDGPGSQADELTVRERITRLGGSPPVSATPLLPRYADWVRWVFERLACDAREFAAFRFVMKYPPIPTAFVFRYALAEQPQNR